MKYKNYLNIQKRFSLFSKYFIYVDVPEGYAIDIFEHDHVHFKVLRTYISHTSNYVIIYVKILKCDISEFVKDMEILNDKMKVCGYPDYDLFCMDFFLKIITKMSAHLIDDLKKAI